MSNEELNRKLAELLGWTNISLYEDNQDPPIWTGRPKDLPRHEWDKRIPDYCTDLNAVHEVEMGLSADPDKQYDYGEYLREAAECTGPRGRHFVPNGFGIWAIATLTAKQRTEALIKTLEEKPFRAISFSPGKSESDPIKETFSKL